MLFTEPTFLFVFLPVVLALHLVPGATYRNVLLVAASVVFYASGAGAFTGLVLTMIAVNYVAALGVDRWRGRPGGRWALRAAVAVNLLVLATFKYTGFLGQNLNALLTATGQPPLTWPEIALPIGISFFTFHAISYVVDVARGDAVAQKGPVEAALYLLLFPQLIAGPIIRYREIASQLKERSPSLLDAAVGVRRFVVGLAKKMLVANVVAGPADRLFALPPAELTAGLAWLAVACYTLQIYFDFSGYSDMAIGLGRMFGFRFPENFRYPYVATSVQDFWRRWHISLSAWFRDYLYVPLGGNRVASGRVYVNLITVFFLCGLWHGASWTFVLWGLFHGAFLVAERVLPGLGAARGGPARVAGHVYTLAVVMVGWVFFRADTLTGALSMLQAMAGAGTGTPTTYDFAWYLTPEVLVAMVAGVVGATPVVPAVARRLASGGGGEPDSWVLGRGVSAAAALALVVLLSASLMMSAARTYSPFIYFRF